MLPLCCALNCSALQWQVDAHGLVCEVQGGDLRHALTNSSNGELQWRNKGASIALDLVRGLHFLHSHGVRAPCRLCCCHLSV